MQTVLLLGAGASFGSDTAAVPPLGGQLFDALRRFNPTGWGTVPSEFARKFRGDFEAAIAEFGSTHPHALPPLQRAMAAFFFDLVPRASNLYVRLAKRIATAHWPGAICTLNYERLLELSVGAAGLHPVVGKRDNGGPCVELCLPHGCCHIFCEGARGMSTGVSFAAFRVTTDGPVVVLSDATQHRRRIEHDAFPPVMSYFEPTKRTTAGASFITGQRNRWAELTAQADRIVAVGIRLRPHDRHIWDPITQSPASVVYCSGVAAGAEFDAWAARTRGQRHNLVLQGHFADQFEAICQALEL
jgi:hypothetical protein